MKALFLPGIGASHRDFPEYRLVFEELRIVRYEGCLTLQEHLERIDEYTTLWEKEGVPYVIIGHSLGANLVHTYVTSRDLNYLKGYTMIGGGPRFYPLNTWQTIFSLPGFGIWLVLFFIAVGAPFLFLFYGWNGMFQRVNVIDLFRREGVQNIKNVFNYTLLPMMKDPAELTQKNLPVQLIRLPNDLLFPQEGMDEARELIPQIEEYLIPRSLIHFSHHLDVLVVGHIHNWMSSHDLVDMQDLPYDVEYALSNPDSISVEVEHHEIPRLPFVAILLFLILKGIMVNFPRSVLTEYITAFEIMIRQWLNLQDLSNGLIVIIGIMTLFSLLGYRGVISPEIPREKQTKLMSYPKVSIIVPMRNEERNIGTCLSSLLELNYPSFEIIISDGKSEDRSVEVARRTEQEHNSMNIPLIIIEEDDLPTGWVGKSWGCWNAVKQATGDYLLFTDADTIHQQDSLRKAMQIVSDRQLDGLSVIGHLETKSFWEHAILPFFKTLLFILFGGRFANKIGRTLAIGQYILVNSERYYSFGGHEAIKSQIAEDIHLAGRIADLGNFEAYNGNNIYKVRMYQSFYEIQEGLSRNARESVGNSLSLVIIASLGLLIWRIVPLLAIPLLIAKVSPLFSLLLIAYWVFTISLFVIDTQVNGNPWYFALLIPLGIISLIYFLFRASLGDSSTTRVWKGREYSVEI